MLAVLRFTICAGPFLPAVGVADVLIEYGRARRTFHVLLKTYFLLLLFAVHGICCVPFARSFTPGWLFFTLSRCEVFTAKDTVLAWNPISHVSGLLFAATALVSGAKGIVSHGGIPADQFVNTINEYQVSPVAIFVVRTKGKYVLLGTAISLSTFFWRSQIGTCIQKV